MVNRRGARSSQIARNSVEGASPGGGWGFFRACRKVFPGTIWKGVGAASHRGWPGCGWAVTVSGMPFKHNAARRHRIPKTRYRVQNWPAYEAGLKRRGDLTLWLDEAALAKWQAPRRTTPGGQARYSDAAIE